MTVPPEVSKYMSSLSKKRKKSVGGFASPEVQAKIKKIKHEKKLHQEKNKTKPNR